MAETTTTITNAEKAVSLESLEEASKLIATKAEVKQQIAEAVTACANITFAKDMAWSSFAVISLIMFLLQ